MSYNTGFEITMYIFLTMFLYKYPTNFQETDILFWKM